MKVILLSGGSGKRLWPLSGELLSKQFLKIMKDSEGNKSSMLQNTIAQLQRLDLLQDVIVVTAQQQVSWLREQIGDKVACLGEPERRDTFPAIALAAAYLHSELNISNDEIIIVLPVDSNADDLFYERIVELAYSLLQNNVYQLGLIGIKPTEASEQFGYVRVQSVDNNGMMQVAGFKEKPSRKEAEQLLREHALWNCGVFAFRLSYMINLLASRQLPTTYNELYERYTELPFRSFDYEVLEKESRIGCLLYEGAWRDMGSWNAISAVMNTPLMGIGLLDESCVGTNVLNELSIPILVTGLNHAVVIAGQDGILVSSKENVSSIKPLVEKIQSQQSAPDHIRVIGGHSRVLDRNTSEDGKITVTTIVHHIPRGKELWSAPNSIHTVWILSAGSGDYYSSQGRSPAICGNVYMNEGSIRYVARRDSRLTEMVTEKTAYNDLVPEGIEYEKNAQ